MVQTIAAVVVAPTEAVAPFAAVAATSAVDVVAVKVANVARAMIRVRIQRNSKKFKLIQGRFPDRSFGDYHGGNKRDYSSGGRGGGGQRGGARGGGSRGGGGGGYRGRSEPPRGGQGRSGGYGGGQRGQHRQHQVYN